MQTIIKIREEQYKVLNIENEYLFHPFAVGFLEKSDCIGMDCGIHVMLDNYKMALSNMWFTSEKKPPVINGVHPREIQMSDRVGYSYEALNIPLIYTGSIIMGAELIREYGFKDGEVPVYCYKQVLEYIFENGILITTIDHSRAMRRIRKNIDLGYRSLNKFRDRKCIEQFIKSSMIGTYHSRKSKKKKCKVLEKLKKQYQDSACILAEEVKLSSE